MCVDFGWKVLYVLMGRWHECDGSFDFARICAKSPLLLVNDSIPMCPRPAVNDPTGHTWQPWGDWLVYSCVAVLPWAGAELAAGCPEELTAFMQLIDQYMVRGATVLVS